MSVINAFGNKISEIKDMWDIPEVGTYLTKTLTRQLKHLGAKSPSEFSEILKADSKAETTDEYEQRAHDRIKQWGLTTAVALQERAETMFREIRPYVTGPKILDYGCGNGGIGARLKNIGHDVSLADVYKCSTLPQDMPFELLSNDPLKNKYDTALLLTVLHHSDTPIETLKHAADSIKDDGRLVIIESVYGVSKGSELAKLSKNNQLCAASFIDHFANRMIIDPNFKINVPCNFQTPKDWQATFEDLELEMVKTVDLGIDLPAFPEHHHLYVLEKNFTSKT
jgi:SAM-dependent methyltransferase